MSADYQEPAPRDNSLTRAQRRRLERGQPEQAVTGAIGCKFCRSITGTFTKGDNRFVCQTAACRGNKFKGTDPKPEPAPESVKVGPGTSHPHCKIEGEV